jgi:toxin ParE1/3/4
LTASLRFTRSAEGDLLEAWLYVAEENISAADKMVEQIEIEARLLLDQPKMGRSREDLAPDLRSWPTSTPYILFYFPDDHGIIVARVLHHSRDVPSISWWPAH